MLSALDIYLTALACRPDSHSDQGGATIDPWTSEVLEAAEILDGDDWLVSIESHESVCNPERLLADITTWVLDGAVEFAGRQALYVVLRWESGARLSLDLSAVINGEEEAIKFGKANRQRAIFRPSDGLTRNLQGEPVAA